MKYQNYPVERYGDLREMLRAVCEKRGRETAFLQMERGNYRSYRYNRLLADVNGLGTALLELGLGGEKLLLVGKGCYEWAVSYLAVVCGVGTVVPLDPALSGTELSEIARFSEASAVICEDGCIKKLQGEENDLRIVGFSELRSLIRQGNAKLRGGVRDYLDAPIDPNAMCALMFSAKTEGEPLGVMLSHRNLCFNLAEMCSMVSIGEKDVFLSVLPVHHIYECVAGVLCPLSRGASVAFSRGLDWLGEDLRAVQPTVMNCVPAILEGAYRSIQRNLQAHGAEDRVRRAIDVTNAIPNPKLRLSAKQKSFAPLRRTFGGKLRLLTTGGAVASPDVIQGFWELGIPVIQGYGATECAPLIALNRDCAYKADAVGLPSPNSLLDISQMREDGVGEIRYRGDGLMLGYYRMPEKTQEVIRGGWFYTGDLGFLDEDGFLHVVDDGE